MNGSVGFSPTSKHRKELKENVDFSWRRPGAKVVERQLAVIETSVQVDGRPYQQQMLLLSEKELEMMKQSYPSLIVRWAEEEDRKQWALSPTLFADPKGVPTRDMVILPDEVVERMRLAKKQRRR